MRSLVLAASTRACVEQLELLGALALADVLMFPVLKDGQRQWNRYACSATVSWRESAQLFWLRTAEVPFDIVPLRPRDPDRLGIWYAVGPAFLPGGSAMAPGDLLHIQAEAADLDAVLPELRSTVQPWAKELSESVQPAPGATWSRYCAAVTL